MNENIKFDKLLKKHKQLTYLVSQGEKKPILLQKLTGFKLCLHYADYKCECCKKEHHLTLHHMISRINKYYTNESKFLSQRNYFFNLVLLCSECHKKQHNMEERIYGVIEKKKIEKVKKYFNTTNA